MEQEQLEDSSEQNNTVPDARPTKRAVKIIKEATLHLHSSLSMDIL